MKDSRYMIVQWSNRCGYLGERGIAAVEMALILPLILVIVLGIIDFGQFFTARFIITNVAREGASLGSRDIQSATELITLMQTGATPLDLARSGKIYIRRICAGQTSDDPYPAVDSSKSAERGDLSVQSSVIGSNLGLSTALYNHLVFDDSPDQMTADIGELTVVEVFYKYTPITPLSNFIPNLLTRDQGGVIMKSRAVF